MNDSKRIWVWVGVVVIVVAIIVWAVFGFKGFETPPVPQAAFAPQGRLVPQFPTNLILDSNASVSGSYSINYSSSTNQYTAEYNSSSSMASLYSQYKQYLPANGWTITNNITANSNSRGLYAINASSDVAVGIVSQAGGSAVTITYLVK